MNISQKTTKFQFEKNYRKEYNNPEWTYKDSDDYEHGMTFTDLKNQMLENRTFYQKNKNMIWSLICSIIFYIILEEYYIYYCRGFLNIFYQDKQCSIIGMILHEKIIKCGGLLFFIGSIVKNKVEKFFNIKLY